MHNNQKGFSYPLIIILIGLLVVGVFLYYSKNKSQNQQAQEIPKEEKINNTVGYSSYNVYSNKSFGFEFQYDKNSKVTYEVQDGKFYIDGVDKGSYDSGKSGVILKMKNEDLIVKKDGQEMHDDLHFLSISTSKDNCDGLETPNSIIKEVNGFKTIYTEQPAPSGKMIIIRNACIQRDSVHFVLTSETYYDENKEKTKKLFDKIVESFRFLNLEKSEVRWDTNKKIPDTVKVELPKESPDGKEVLPDSLVNDTYLIYMTFVRERGAGLEYDYWLYNRKEKTSVNLSNLLKNDSNFINKKRDRALSPDVASLNHNNTWSGNNPAFSVADGWEVVDEYWIYDIDKKSFFFYQRPETYLQK